MKICLLPLTVLFTTLCAFADEKQEWAAISRELAEVSAEFSIKERELRTAGEGSPELEANARDAFAAFLSAIEEHPALKSYVDKQNTLQSELETAIQNGDDKDRQSALIALQKLQGEQLQAALKIPELLKLKETADTATRNAQQALVKSDPEAQSLLAKRQQLLDRLTELSAKSE